MRATLSILNFSYGIHFYGRLYVCVCLCGCHSVFSVFLSSHSHEIYTRISSHEMFAAFTTGHFVQSLFRLFSVAPYLFDRFALYLAPIYLMTSWVIAHHFQVKWSKVNVTRIDRTFCRVHSINPVPTWPFHLILGSNITQEVSMCCVEFSYEKFIGGSHRDRPNSR